MTQKQSIKLYEDGDRIIVVFDHATTDLKHMLQALLSPAIQKSIENLAPPEVPEDTIPDIKKLEEGKKRTEMSSTDNLIRLEAGPYKGKTPDEVAEMGEDVLKDVYTHFSKYATSAESKKEVRMILMRTYLPIVSNAELAADSMSDYEVREFLDKYQFLFPEELKQAMNQAGYTTCSLFLQETNTDMLRELSKQCARAVLQRMSNVQ